MSLAEHAENAEEEKFLAKSPRAPRRQKKGRRVALLANAGPEVFLGGLCVFARNSSFFFSLCPLRALRETFFLI
jgi:hypothetical protein